MINMFTKRHTFHHFSSCNQLTSDSEHHFFQNIVKTLILQTLIVQPHNVNANYVDPLYPTPSWVQAHNHTVTMKRHQWLVVKELLW